MRFPDEEAELREELVESIEWVLESQEMEQVARTSAQILMAQGRKEGLEEGRREAEARITQERHEGRLAFLLAQIEFKFGAVSSEQREQIEQLSPAELDAVGLRLLNAQTWNDLRI